ncbi:hypothetical protein LTR17_007858 [Elasticomyces elasticus]|nr:hypothetical protein LTR17_007858 [Elasticomyces elasticus]
MSSARSSEGDGGSQSSYDSDNFCARQSEYCEGLVMAAGHRPPLNSTEPHAETAEELIQHAYLDVTKADQSKPLVTVHRDDLIDVLKYQMRLARGLTALGQAHTSLGSTTGGNAALGVCQENLGVITAFLTNALDSDPLATLPSEHSGELAMKVFSIPELAELILLRVSTADLL